MSGSEICGVIEVSCGNCHFFEEVATKQKTHTSHTYGRCRRFPPYPIFNGLAKSKEHVTPLVREDDWCGEFEINDDPTELHPTPSQHN